MRDYLEDKLCWSPSGDAYCPQVRDSSDELTRHARDDERAAAERSELPQRVAPNSASLLNPRSCDTDW